MVNHSFCHCRLTWMCHYVSQLRHQIFSANFLLFVALLYRIGLAQGLDQCPPGFYGNNCTTRCSINCGQLIKSDTQPCIKESGKCSEGCKDGFYGDTCNKTCSPLCESNTCRQNDGLCQCVRGYKKTVNGCEKDQGKECKTLSNCKNNRCYSTRDEECVDGCKFGYFGDLCQNKCTSSCVHLWCTRYTGQRCQHECELNCSVPECKAVCQTEISSNDEVELTTHLNIWGVGILVFLLLLTGLVLYSLLRMRSLIYLERKRINQLMSAVEQLQETRGNCRTVYYSEVNEGQMDQSDIQPPNRCTQGQRLDRNMLSSDSQLNENHLNQDVETPPLRHKRILSLNQSTYLSSSC